MDQDTYRNHRRCASCGAPLEAGDRFCSVCGADQTAAQRTRSRSSSWRCSKCGALNAEDMAFCTQCGKKKAAPHRSSRWIGWLAALLAVAGIAVFVILYAYPKLIRPALASVGQTQLTAAEDTGIQPAESSSTAQAKTTVVFANGGSIVLPNGFREVQVGDELLSTSYRDAGGEYTYSFTYERDDGTSAAIDIYEGPLHVALSEEDLAAADSPIEAVYRVLCLSGMTDLEDRVVVRDGNEITCTGKQDGNEMRFRCILEGETMYFLFAHYPVESRNDMAPLCEEVFSSFSAPKTAFYTSPETEPPAAPASEPPAAPASEPPAISAPVGPIGPGVLNFAYGAKILIFEGFTDTSDGSYVDMGMPGGYQYHFYNELLSMRIDLYEAPLKNVLALGIASPVESFTADGYLDARYKELIDRDDVTWSLRGDGFCSVMYVVDDTVYLERYIVDQDIVYVMEFRYPQAEAQSCYPLADTMIANFIPAGQPDYLSPAFS